MLRYILNSCDKMNVLIITNIVVVPLYTVAVIIIALFNTMECSTIHSNDN